ncbi:MAG: hypothetical protein JNN07_21490 [Verrucomicrobiales bacterium]|nr:hypothetical protein [Verrucomicrobiales bacterium]
MQFTRESATDFCVLFPSFPRPRLEIMHHLSSELPSVPPGIPNSRGGRISSAELRHAQQQCEDFAGLEANTDRYRLLLLVKRAGKAAGFSARMIHLLDYYMAFTRDSDWEEGARPVVYQSLSKTALDLGVSERQIQRLEQALFEAGALTWNDSGNHRRYGQRCAKTGRILYAYGVDLTPLAYLKADLEAKLQEKELYDRAWMETKRQISWHRRQICGRMAEAEEGADRPDWMLSAATRYQALAVPIRTYMSLEDLRALLASHRELHREITADAEGPHEVRKSDKPSSDDDRNVAHNNLTNQESSDESDTGRRAASCFRESVVEPVSPKSEGKAARDRSREEGAQDLVLATGIQHISPKQILNAASERFKAHIPIEPRPMNWNDLVEAAYRLKSELQISQSNWGEACLTLGRIGATVCLVLTDQAMQRENDPVRKPGAYFRAMVNRAHTGELRLHSSVFGILKREEG